MPDDYGDYDEEYEQDWEDDEYSTDDDEDDEQDWEEDEYSTNNDEDDENYPQRVCSSWTSPHNNSQKSSRFWINLLNLDRFFFEGKFPFDDIFKFPFF